MKIASRALVSVIAFGAIVVACETATEIDTNLYYFGSLNGAKEKPTAVTSAATGTMIVTLTKSGSLSYVVNWLGLDSGTMAHIHGPADSNNTAGVLLDFAALPPGSSQQTLNLAANGMASGTVNVQAAAVITATVTGDSLVKLLNAGLLYVNVHTKANGAGEIRSQLKKP